MLLRRKGARAIAIFVGLWMWWFTSYFSWHWLGGRSIVPNSLFHFGRQTIYSPIEWYNSSSTRSAAYIRATAEWSYAQGKGRPRPWRELVDFWLNSKSATPVKVPSTASAPVSNQ
jgi:hypothetical protein